MTPEEYFFRYAFPCTELRYFSGKISKETFEKIKEYARKAQTPPREILMKAYEGAFRRITQRMNVSGEAIWDIKVFREYFLKVHSQSLDEGDIDDATKRAFPEKSQLETFIDICKVHTAVIEGSVQKDGMTLLEVRYGAKRRKVLNYYNLPVSKGDSVTIHYGIAVEQV